MAVMILSPYLLTFVLEQCAGVELEENLQQNSCIFQLHTYIETFFVDIASDLSKIQMYLPWLFHTFNQSQAGAPVAFKTWCGHQYRVGIMGANVSSVVEF